MKERNPRLVDTIDRLNGALIRQGATIFTDEPDVRVFGTHPEMQNIIELFWRRSFFPPNEIAVVSYLPRGDRDYEGTVADPQMRMKVSLKTGGMQCIELGPATPQDIVFGVVKRDKPAHRREGDLLPALYSLAKSAEIRELYDHTVIQDTPLRFEVRKIELI